MDLVENHIFFTNTHLAAYFPGVDKKIPVYIHRDSNDKVKFSVPKSDQAYRIMRDFTNGPYVDLGEFLINLRLLKAALRRVPAGGTIQILPGGAHVPKQEKPY